MNLPLVSLIIPVYNVQDYLRKCLNSVAAQTYQNLEVIIVNDGSPDNSLEIILQYTAKYPHFHCYTIENRGLGGARNYGMEQATGDYILFLDSDDYISPDCVEKFATAAVEQDSDIVISNCHDVLEDGRILLSYRNQYRAKTTSLYQEPELLFNRVSAWGKLYKRTLIDGFQFVSREWYEDMRLIPKLYLHADKITYVDDFLFYYVQRSGSIMNSGNCQRNLEIITAFRDLLSYYRDHGKYAQFRDALEFLVIEHVAVAGISRVAMTKGNDRKEVLDKLQDYLSEFDNLYDNPYLPQQDKNRKIALWCNRHRWYWMTKLLLTAKHALQK